MCWFENNKVDLLITKEGSSDDIILKSLNKMTNLKKIKLFEKIEVIICPLEILYVIKKSHIHRILPITNNSSENSKIWKRQMNYYTDMRNKLGYDKMDKILYGEKKYGEPVTETFINNFNINFFANYFYNSNDSQLEMLMRKIFTLRFDEINQRVSDTKINMNKQIGQFFDDNIQRFIEHDDLHKKIGLLCRNNDSQLFHLFQKDPSYANLDYNLFFASNYQDRIQLFREEIMVLFLERKVIPELILCYKNDNLVFTSFDIDIKKSEFSEIIAHFVTNLCDQGHSWLIQYLLDHYNTYCVYDSYDMDSLYQIAFDIANINSHNLFDYNNTNTHSTINNTEPDFFHFIDKKFIYCGCSNENKDTNDSNFQCDCSELYDNRHVTKLYLDSDTDINSDTDTDTDTDINKTINKTINKNVYRLDNGSYEKIKIKGYCEKINEFFES